MLDRDEDMAITGQRHAFMGRYKVRWLAGLPGFWCACVAWLQLVSDASSALRKPPACIWRASCCAEGWVHKRGHPARAVFPKVGFTKEGRLLALDLSLFCNAGNSLDLRWTGAVGPLLHLSASAGTALRVPLQLTHAPMAPPFLSKCFFPMH